jgi:DeoR family glycerol-3-phosphate regulon repressor
MPTRQRRAHILELLQKRGYVSIESLAVDLDVSAQSIRRDLNVMAKDGLLARQPGGASLLSSVVNTAYVARQVERLEEKERIARAVAAFIPDRSSLFLTLGTTMEALAEALLERKGLMIVTHNPAAAMILNRKPDFEIFLTGGAMRKGNNGLVGNQTVSAVEAFRCDYLLMSVGGIDALDGSLLDFNPSEVSVVQAMMRCARRTLLAADKTKFGRKAAARVARLSEVAAWFVDAPAGAELRALATEAGVELVEG